MAVIGFIGTGNMGGALARAAAKGNNCVLLANRTPAKAQLLAGEIGGQVCTNEEAAEKADILFLGVKPYLMPEVMKGVSGILENRRGCVTIVSMAAGVPIEDIEGVLGAGHKIIRIMPNTPVSVGEGMIMYCLSTSADAACEKDFLDAMSAAGRFMKLDEKLLDAGSGVSGCGPAFVAMFIEALADGGVACGLPRPAAYELACQTLRGTAALVSEGGLHPGVLKDGVCSPGGTTIQGVRKLEECGFRGAVMDAVIATFEKNSSLKKG